MLFSPKTGAAFLSVCFCLFVLSAGPATSQTRDEGPWWPHPIWGAEDQAGASNWITPEKVLEAVSLVKTGKVYELGHIYERGMPLLGQRSFAMFLAPGAVSETTGLLFNDDFLATEIGQVGTQLDGLGHVGKRVQMEDGAAADVFYNGFTLDEIRSQHGLRQLGVEKIKPYFTRGILIDVAGYKEVEVLPNEYVVTLSDVRGALAAQGLDEGEIKPGDAIFFNFGWTTLWNDPPRMIADWRRKPVVGQNVLDWIVDQKPSLVGWDAAASREGHARLTLMNGIPGLEFMDFSELLADDAYEFMFVFTPLRLKGATGSPGRPLAIR